MPAVWFALKRSMHCRTERRDVYDPNGKGNRIHLSNIQTKRTESGRSGCSKSIANLKDVVIHGSKRHTEEKPSICSPRSIGSSELLNPITHEVVLNNSTCELKISAGCGFQDGGDEKFVGTLKPGTPGPARLHLGRRQRSGILGSPIRPTSNGVSWRSSGLAAITARPRSSFESDSCRGLFCNKCGEEFVRWEAVEEHHLSKHAVTELAEGDSSRKIVEIICRPSSSKPDNINNGGIEKILKIHNMQKTLAQFEEYRELVKIRASKLTKKHPRCLADGNELLRFHGTTVECSLGTKGSSSLCKSDRCQVCRILRNGFSTKKDLSQGIGVFTASTSGRAVESIRMSHENPSFRKALIVCRVVAGRVHRPVENVQEISGHQSGFDSLAGKIGLHSNTEELYLLSPKALLPCFVVIYRNS